MSQEYLRCHIEISEESKGKSLINSFSTCFIKNDSRIFMHYFLLLPHWVGDVPPEWGASMFLSGDLAMLLAKPEREGELHL